MDKKFVDMYLDVVTPVINRSPKIFLSVSEIQQITDHAIKRSEYKKREYDHMIDNDREIERTVTGLVGEMAVEKLLGVNIIDWTIGNSSKYNHPDIPGTKVGIKTVEHGKYPIIFKDNYYSQIICIRDTTHNNLVYICGLATADILNAYQSDDLILNRKLREKGYKTGFYGFNKLIEIKSLSDIRKYS